MSNMTNEQMLEKLENLVAKRPQYIVLTNHRGLAVLETDISELKREILSKMSYVSDTKENITGWHSENW